MQDKRQRIEIDDGGQPLRKIMKETGKIAVQRNRLGDLQQGLIFRGGSTHILILSVGDGLQESGIRVVRIFLLERIAQFLEKSIKCVVLIRRNFQGREHTAEIRAMIAVMKKADIPFAAQRIEKLQ